MECRINNSGQKLFFDDSGSLSFILNPVYTSSKIEKERVSNYMAINFPDLNYTL